MFSSSTLTGDLRKSRLAPATGEGPSVEHEVVTLNETTAYNFTVYSLKKWKMLRILLGTMLICCQRSKNDFKFFKKYCCPPPTSQSTPRIKRNIPARFVE